MKCCLPEDKLRDLRLSVVSARGSVKLQSLLAKLNPVCQIMPMGQIFNRLLVAAMAGVLAPGHCIRLTRGLKVDLQVWETFLDSYNGQSVCMSDAMSSFDLELFTDAAGSVGYGAYFCSQWSVGPWPEEFGPS